MKPQKSLFYKIILKEGKYFFIIPLLVLILTYIFANPSGLFYQLVLVISFILVGYTLFFLRPPKNFPVSDPNTIYASADGYILDIKENVTCEYFPNETFHKVTIFMHVASMHWNQAPIEGEIVFEEFNKGKFKNAFGIIDSWKDNEHQVIGIQNKTTGLKAVVVMVAGLIARRIRFFGFKGESLTQGDILGLIRYGSANILYIPSDFKIQVQVKQKSRSGKTVIATK